MQPRPFNNPVITLTNMSILSSQQCNTIGEMIAYFRENFGERFIVNETAVERSTVDRILRNVTEFEGEIVLLREELRELIDMLTNKTATTINLILPAAMASEDVVGEILEAGRCA